MGDWLSDQIALGNKPPAILDAFSRAIGIGMRMYADVSAEGADSVGIVVGGIAKAAIIYAALTQVTIQKLREN